MVLLKAFEHLFSKQHRDGGTKSALTAIFGTPFVTSLLQSNQVQDAAQALQVDVLQAALSPDILPYLAGLAILLGVARGVQPGQPT